MILPDIPEELVEEILCRVPATSLKRLRSTCKQWNRLFTDRIFSRKHFDKAAKQFPALVMTKERTLCSLNVNLHDGIPSAEVTGELSLKQVMISDVFHCDGLLLCTSIKDSTSIVVWNPCTGQTKWIENPKSGFYQRFALGNYQDNNSSNKSYKVLSYYAGYNRDQKFDIYDMNSNSWRNLDVTPIPDYMLCYDSYVSLKGKTYWFVWPRKSSAFPVGLISFDYTTERFERLRLPYRCNTPGQYSLSVFREEKLSVLLQHAFSSKREVWITKKIDNESKEMSWSKLLEVEVGIGRRALWLGRGFLVDEEKIIVFCCEGDYSKVEPAMTVSIAGADSNDTPLRLFPVKTKPLVWPFCMNYVPSLIQI